MAAGHALQENEICRDDCVIAESIFLHALEFT